VLCIVTLSPERRGIKSVGPASEGDLILIDATSNVGRGAGD
jgi:hypothetical protein